MWQPGRLAAHVVRPYARRMARHSPGIESVRCQRSPTFNTWQAEAHDFGKDVMLNGLNDAKARMSGNRLVVPSTPARAFGRGVTTGSLT